MPSIFVEKTIEKQKYNNNQHNDFLTILASFVYCDGIIKYRFRQHFHILDYFNQNCVREKMTVWERKRETWREYSATGNMKNSGSRHVAECSRSTVPHRFQRNIFHSQEFQNLSHNTIKFLCSLKEFQFLRLLFCIERKSSGWSNNGKGGGSDGVMADGECDGMPEF